MSDHPVGSPFAVDLERLESVLDREYTVARANRVAGGEYFAFHNQWRALPAEEHGWNVHPVSKRPYPEEASWWSVSHFAQGYGDIKEIWEPARFSWVYDLIRGFSVSRESHYSEAFFRHFSAFCDDCPPFRGVQWACGQEVAIRSLAVLYAEAVFSEDSEFSADRQEQVVEFLGASGERIKDAIGYAVSQRNNHAISEAAGLMALGYRLANAHPEADRWFRKGRKVLERSILEQFAPDGWYIQHSFNYLRLALDQCVVAHRVLRAAGHELTPRAKQRIEAAVNLLCAVIEPSTGIMPNHGANDGALVHPISIADYSDYRPVLTATCSTFGLPMPGTVAPDPSALAWLDSGAPDAAEPTGDSCVQGASGWVAVHVGEVFVFMWAGKYRSRPGHIDALHVDIRFGTQPVVVDPGTYSYNAPEPWRTALASAGVHNGPLINDEEPGVRGPRFLWLSWPHAVIRDVRQEADCYTIIAERPALVRRTVRVFAARVEVTDELLVAPAMLSTCWLLHPDVSPDWLQPSTESCRWRVAQEGDARGWFSPCYGVRIASRYLQLRNKLHQGEHNVVYIGPLHVQDQGGSRMSVLPERSSSMRVLS